MKLKKLFLFATTLLMTASTFVSCSKSMGGAMMGAMDNAYVPEMGVMQEEYTEIIENDFIKASEQPSSYFSIDANTASYPNLRSLINNHASYIDKDAVRVEEMLNYFDYDYATPTGDDILFLLKHTGLHRMLSVI